MQCGNYPYTVNIEFIKNVNCCICGLCNKDHIIIMLKKPDNFRVYLHRTPCTGSDYKGVRLEINSLPQVMQRAMMAVFPPP